MGGGDKQHVMIAFVGDGDVRENQWLGIKLAIDRIGEEFAERVAVDVGQRQRRLVGILAGSRIVVVKGEDIDLRESCDDKVGTEQECNEEFDGRKRRL